MNNSYYKDKVILITGAASGIGRRFAELVSRDTPCTLILWDRNPEILAEFSKTFHDRVTVHTRDVDVSDYRIIQTAAEDLLQKNIVPNIIINCAGIVVGKMFDEHTPEEIHATLQINTAGSMYVTHAFIHPMIKRGTGHIVNLASASGYIGNPRMSVYAASKWAVIGWSDSLRLEMQKGETGIHVTTVIPSYIKTGMFEGVKAPWLVPLLETDTIVKKMIRGIARQKSKIEAPFMIRLVPFIRSILPEFLFDRVAGNLLGVYRSMDSFKGRKKELK